MTGRSPQRAVAPMEEEEAPEYKQDGKPFRIPLFWDTTIRYWTFETRAVAPMEEETPEYKQDAKPFRIPLLWDTTIRYWTFETRS